MSRYLIKFSKQGYIKYTSHLDMVRLFTRIFKRTGIYLKYSQGFNPHPKMSFVQPLSLGYSSLFELVEIETKFQFIPSEMREKLNSVMPEGLEILDVTVLPDDVKTIASLTEKAEYVIEFPIKDKERNFVGICNEFMAQPEIMASKKQKKTGKIIEKDIKPMIKSMDIAVVDDKLIMSAVIDQGSISNLSPELLIVEFNRFAKLEADRNEIEVERTKIIYKIK